MMKRGKNCGGRKLRNNGEREWSAELPLARVISSGKDPYTTLQGARHWAGHDCVCLSGRRRRATPFPRIIVAINTANVNGKRRNEDGSTCREEKRGKDVGNGARAQQYSFWNVHFSLSLSLPLVISVS